MHNWFMLLAVHFRVMVDVMVHLGSLESTQEARVALGYRLEQLVRVFRALSRALKRKGGETARALLGDA